MKLLYSNILPLRATPGQELFIDRFGEAICAADEVHIAVGYISKAALQELDALVESSGIKKIVLTIGMLYIEGMPEGSYHVALELHNKWTATKELDVSIVSKTLDHCDIKPLGVIDFYFLDGSHIGLVTKD